MPKMSSTSNFLFLFLITIFLLSQVSSFEDAIEAQAHQSQSSTSEVVKGLKRRLSSVDCEGLCGVRCGKHSRPNVCTRACGTCCQRCNCVPPGTHGNREMCGTCYTDMMTHGNRFKCP